jgi:hypothetical protein
MDITVVDNDRSRGKMVVCAASLIRDGWKRAERERRLVKEKTLKRKTIGDQSGLKD